MNVEELLSWPKRKNTMRGSATRYPKDKKSNGEPSNPSKGSGSGSTMLVDFAKGEMTSVSSPISNEIDDQEATNRIITMLGHEGMKTLTKSEVAVFEMIVHLYELQDGLIGPQLFIQHALEFAFVEDNE